MVSVWTKSAHLDPSSLARQTACPRFVMRFASLHAFRRCTCRVERRTRIRTRAYAIVRRQGHVNDVQSCRAIMHVFRRIRITRRGSPIFCKPHIRNSEPQNIADRLEELRLGDARGDFANALKYKGCFSHVLCHSMGYVYGM